MISSLTAHLWQSTFFVLAVALFTLVFRGNRAQVRYWLWLSASVKFLVPFAVLMSVGSALETWVPATQKIAPPVVSFAEEYVAQPFPGTLSFVPAASRGTDWILSILLGLWACGFLTIAMIRLRNWLRIRAAVRAGTETDIHATVDIRISPGLLEPGVVGLLRPILLLPEGITERLTPSELKAVLAHELCHVRRRDNLFAAVHMVVETVFWFHPLVWWIGARLVEERERACDEEVLQQGNAADVYADAILSVCKLYVESPLTCVAGVSGASIRRRIEVIMSSRRLQRLNIAKTFLLAAAAAAALAGPVTIGLLISVGHAPAIRAQSPAPKVTQTVPVQMAQAPAPQPKPAVPQAPAAAPRPKFDVVSVRRCMPGDELNGPPGGRGGGKGRGPRFSPGRLRVQCLAVSNMIRLAYLGVFGDGLLNYNAMPDDTKWLRNAPAWVNSDWYTVDAETDDPVANGPTGTGQRDAEKVMEQMLQLVLEDRFQLKMHRDTEEVPMYNLTVAKGGLKVKPMEAGGCFEHDPTKGVMTGEMFPPGQKPMCTIWLHMNGPDWALDAAGQKPGNLVGMLGNALNRHVFDKTGVTDLFIFHLQFAHDETTPGNFPPEMQDRLFPPSDVPSGASIFTVLEGIGLKLEPTKGPQGYIVVDHVERPSEN
jgi:bla regulator protein BlaR1